MKAVGYFRESAQDGASLAQQNKVFLDFCSRNGLDVDCTFAEQPSANGTAPVFRQLLQYVRRHADEVTVVVPGIDALGGDLTDAARRYFQIEGLGAHVTPMDGAGDLAGDIVTAWSAQDDGGRLADRVRQAMRKKAVKGEVLGRPPYGYKVGSRRRLELIPEEAVVVRYIFRLYLREGLGIRLIARRLNEEGLRTRRGGNWSMVSIRDILRNRAYLGTYVRFGVRVPGSHPPLVSAEDFKAVQDRLNARRTSYNPRVTSQFLLSGLALCGYCGNKLIGVSRRQAWKRQSGERVENSYRYYQCESRTNQSVCNYHTRRAGDLESDVHAAIAGVLASPPPEPVADDRARLADEREREKLRSRARTIDRRLERYVEAAAKGRLSAERLRALGLSAAADRLAVEDAIESADRRLADASDADARRAARDVTLTSLQSSWETMPFAERRAALRDAIAAITVTDDAVTITPRP